MADPFTLTHDAIWDCLESNAGFTALVPEVNRIKLTGTNFQPNQETKANADYPYVRQIPNGADTPIFRSTSDEGILVRTYQIQIDTDQILCGGTSYPNSIYNIEWEVYKALLNWRDYFGPDALTIDDKNGDPQKFITCAQFGTVEQGVTNPEAAERNVEIIGGWVALFSIEVHMYFSRALFAPTV
jgi:hypothetical protein